MIDQPVRWIVSALLIFAVLPAPVAQMSGNARQPTTPGRPTRDGRAASLRLPMRFEAAPNREGGPSRFIARGPNYAVSLEDRQATLVFAPPSATGARSSLTMRLVGASADAIPSAGLEPLPGTTNHLIGSDPRQWTIGARGFRKVQYCGVYRGIDIVYYGAQRQLEYDFVVAPGARPADIAIAFDGARHVRIDADGGLTMTTDAGELRQPPPVVYQTIDGARRFVRGSFAMNRAGHVGFRVGPYDRREPLVIDPVLTYSTYLGGGAGDAAMGVAVDGGGNIYVAGETASLDFPHPNAAQATFGGSLDAFVAKLDPNGNQLVYATYLGGSQYEYAKDIAVDPNGNAYVVGSTTSRNFPTINALQPTLSGFSDGFVAKLDASGVPVYVTYLGGANEDLAYGIAVDGSGRAHVVGQTISADFPVVGALQPSLGGGVAHKTVDGGQSWPGLTALKAASILSMAVDPVDSNNVYAGTESGVARSRDGGLTWTINQDTPVPVWALAVDPATPSRIYAGTDYAVMRSLDGGATWAPIGPFGVAVTSLAIDPTAPRTIYAGSQQNSYSLGVVKSTDGGDHWTEIGMGSTIRALAISRSSPGTIYAGGEVGVFKTTTGASNRWTLTANGPKDVHALVVDPTIPATVYAGDKHGLFKSTTGGDEWSLVAGVSGGSISALAMPNGAANTLYAGSPFGGIAVSHDAGATWSFGGPGTPIFCVAVDPTLPETAYAGSSGQWDAFVARFSPDGAALEYSTYLGGSSVDYGNAIALDAAGNAYVVGTTRSSDFPVLNPLQSTFHGVYDLFVAKISPVGALSYATYLGGSMWEDRGTIAVDAYGQAHVAGYTYSADFPTANAYQPVFGGDSDAFVAAIDASGSRLLYSTFLGGSGSEVGPGGYTVGRDPVTSIAVTPSGDAYVTGATSSADFPTLRPIQASYGGGGFDAFVAKFSAEGLLQWSTFLGGSTGDFGKRVALDGTGAVVVAGYTDSTTFPTRNPLQLLAGADDAFVTRIAEDAPDPTAPTTTISFAGAAGQAGWYRSPVIVTLSATDAAGESGVAFVDYAINDTAFRRYASPLNVTDDGNTRVTARATDNSGNVEAPPPTAVVKIDTVPPLVSIDSPVERDYLQNGSVPVTFGARDDLSGLAGNGPSATLDGLVVAAGQTIPALTLAPGAHTLVASATDLAGNNSQRSVTFHVIATIQSLMALVNTYSAQGLINPSTSNSLIAKLTEAQSAQDRGNMTVVRNKLLDFIDVCSKRVTPEAATVLIAGAQYVLGAP